MSILKMVKLQGLYSFVSLSRKSYQFSVQNTNLQNFQALHACIFCSFPTFHWHPKFATVLLT